MAPVPTAIANAMGDGKYLQQAILGFFLSAHWQHRLALHSQTLDSKSQVNFPTCVHSCSINHVVQHFMHLLAVRHVSFAWVVYEQERYHSFARQAFCISSAHIPSCICIAVGALKNIMDSCAEVPPIHRSKSFGKEGRGAFCRKLSLKLWMASIHSGGAVAGL